MKLKILLLLGAAVAGVGASYALAANGRGNGPHAADGPGHPCGRSHLVGTVAAPQTLTVVVTKAGPRNSSLTPDQTVTVTLGSAGQTVRVNVEGCVTDTTSLTANEAELHVVAPHGQGRPDHQTTTDTGTSPTTTDS